MEAQTFLEANVDLTKPKEWDDRDCHTLKVFRGLDVLPTGGIVPIVTSKWLPSAEELDKLNRGEGVFVTTIGMTIQPMMVRVGNPVRAYSCEIKNVEFPFDIKAIWFNDNRINIAGDNFKIKSASDLHTLLNCIVPDQVEYGLWPLSITHAQGKSLLTYRGTYPHKVILERTYLTNLTLEFTEAASIPSEYPQPPTKPLPEENPDTVIITDEYMCQIHKWKLNAPAEVMFKHIDGMRDANGYHIHVKSVEWHRPVYLHSSQYKLVSDEQA